jgi:hypothetical protein
MSVTSRTGFLVRGTKRKVKAMFFMDIVCIKSPFWTGLRIAFPCFILRVQRGYNSGTNMLKQHVDFGRYYT